MTTRPKFKLSRLRDIGWSLWDPIGLSGMENTPDDEYDTYLLKAAGRLWEGASEEEVADYLVSIETEYMGLGDVRGVSAQARKVVSALSEYVSELRG
jgi:hypothetical protein